MSPERPAPTGLDDFAGPITIAEKIALTDSRVRTHISYAVAGTFLMANLLILAGVAYVFHADDLDLAAKIIAPKDRIVTADVLIAVVGGTTVQLGALAITMGKYLFPRQRV